MGDKDVNMKYLIVAIIVFIIFASAYCSGLLSSMFAGNKSFGLISIAKHIIANGFPTSMFMAFVLLFVGIFVYMFFSTSKDSGANDKLGRAFKMSTRRQSYGDSHFEEPDEYKEVANIKKVDDTEGTILGQLDKNGKNLIEFRHDSENRLNKHIAIVGASGSGKTYTFSKPYCYQTVKRRESIVLTDPDGGLYRDLAGYFEDNGYIVKRFDLNNLHRSDGWDCLKSIRPETAELDAQLISQVIISNLVEDMQSIYGTGPMSLLKALILYVYFDSSHDGKRNIKSVYELLQNESGEEFLNGIFKEELLSEEARVCLKPYLAFKQGSPNLRGNLITNLAVQLQLLQNETVGKVLSTDEIDLTLPAEKPCAYFCIFPDSHDTYKFIVSLFFSLLFIKMIEYADNQEDGKLPITVNFLLDEFPSIGKLPDWDRKMATIRKRAMNVVMIFQDITQFQNLYAKTWVTILANCSTLVALGINDGETSALFARRIGETTIEAQTLQHDAMESAFTVFLRNSTGEGRRSLMSYDEIFKMDKDNSLIIFQGHNPILAKKYPHTLHPASKELRTILPKDIPSINDVEKREEWNKEKERKLKEFYENHPELSENGRKIEKKEKNEEKEETGANFTEILLSKMTKIKELLCKALNRSVSDYDYEKERSIKEALKNATQTNLEAENEDDLIPNFNFNYYRKKIDEE